MFLRSFEITPQTLVSSIVDRDYRTADIFKKYGIEYCCGGRRPLELACQLNGVELKSLMDEIEYATRPQVSPGNLPFHEWNIDFLVDYIVNIHHFYLRKALPGLHRSLEEFATSHSKQYPYFQQVLAHLNHLEENLLTHLQYEEDVLFPYLRQVSHAFDGQDHYARLLVKTLRKPIGSMMDDEHKILYGTIHAFRQLTDQYAFPEKCCTNHSVVLSKLKELDNNITQHVYLENDVLYPRIISMEKELLSGTHGQN